ncbi:MAG: hypothetical protein Kow0099_05460 [Candidatus Abyssubacteria bacterium]
MRWWKIRENLRSLTYFLIGCGLAVIAARALPYDEVREMHFPLLKIENILYAAAVLFIIGKALEPPHDVTRFFTMPTNVSSNSRLQFGYKDVLICGAVFLFSIVYHLVIYDKELPNPDEGWILVLSDRVLRQELPYRDFFMLTSPGAIYFNAWLFRVFGASIIVERIATLVLASLGASAVYLVARLGMGFFFSVSASLLYIAWQFPHFFQANYSWYAIVSSIFAYLVMGWTITRDEKRDGRFFLIGLICGISFLFKQNIGAFTLLACSLYAPIEHILFDNRVRRTLLFPVVPLALGVRDILGFFKQYAAMFLGFALPLGACAYLFYSKGHMTDFIQGAFINPLTKTAEFMTPYEPISRLTDKRIMMYMPHLTMAVTLVVFFWKFRRGSLEGRDRFPLLLLLATLFSLLSAYPRADFIHIVYTLWPSLILLAFWTQLGVESISRRWPKLTQVFAGASSFDSRLRCSTIALLSCLPLMIFFIHRTGKNLEIETSLEELTVARGRGIYGRRWEVKELNQMIEFIERHSPHDPSNAIFSTNPLVYFLTNRPNPTPYDYVLAGNGPAGYVDDIVRTIEEEKPGMVVLDRLLLRWYPIPPDWWKIQDSIFRNYTTRFSRRLGRYVVLMPKTDEEWHPYEGKPERQEEAQDSEEFAKSHAE